MIIIFFPFLVAALITLCVFQSHFNNDEIEEYDYVVKLKWKDVKHLYHKTPDRLSYDYYESDVKILIFEGLYNQDVRIQLFLFGYITLLIHSHFHNKNIKSTKGLNIINEAEDFDSKVRLRIQEDEE